EIPERYYGPLSSDASPEFLVLADRIVLFFAEMELVYNRQTKSFSSAPAPLNSAHTFQDCSWSILYNEESILEMFPGTDEARVLASVRRRPAITVLDMLPSLTNSQMLSVDNNHLYALIANQLYLLETNQWRAVLNSNSVKSAEVFSGEFFLHESLRNDEKSNH